MTTGSYNDITNVPIPGAIITSYWQRQQFRSWSGVDSATVRRLKPSFTKRVVFEPISVPPKRRGGSPTTRWVKRSFRVYDVKTKPVDDRKTPHAYSMNFTTADLGALTMREVSNGQVYVIGVNQGPGLPDTAIADPWGSDDEYKLLSKLKVKTEGDFNLASFLGAEGIDTVRFIGDAANRIYRSLLALRKGNVNRAVSLIKGRKVNGQGFTREGRIQNQLSVYQELVGELAQTSGKRRVKGWRALTANQWLEYHLAAEPLLGDVKSAAEQLAYTLNRPQQLTYRVHREVERSRGGIPDVSGDVWGNYSLFHKVAITAYLKELPTIAQLSGVMDPEIVLWNALPLSFVADWWLPIGDWLEARASASHLTGQFVRSEKIYTTHSNYLGAVYPPPSGPYARICLNDSKAFRRNGSFTRTILTSLAVPLPRWHPLGPLTSLARSLTGAALLSNFARGLPFRK